MMQSSRKPPRVWLVMGYRAGERSQILALGEALGWPFEVKHLAHEPYGSVIDLLRGSNLLGVDRQRGSPLRAPWPDLVVSAGMRNEPVCRWIRAQSGGRTRLVHIGRPWASLECFDLVVTTAQYALPEHPRVLHNSTTLHRVTAERLVAEARRWAPRLGQLPQPRITVAVGGNSGPYTFGTRAATRLGRRASAMAAARGGCLLVTTSARTPPRSLRALERTITVPTRVYRWRHDDPQNPYYGYLASADEIIVTGDSIAMLSEACATRKPVHLFDLATGAGASCGAPRAASGARDERGREDLRLAAFLYRRLMRFGPALRSRDVRRVHRVLREAGRVVCLGESFPGRPPPLQDVERTVRRVRALFEGVQHERGAAATGR